MEYCIFPQLACGGSSVRKTEMHCLLQKIQCIKATG
jgi:hypothetical protein